MIPGRIIGRSSGENWTGLIDGTYAIILTLLVIELPLIVIENRKDCKIAKQEGSNTNCNLCIGMEVLLALFD